MEVDELKKLLGTSIPKSAVGLSEADLAADCFPLEDHLEIGEKLEDHLIVGYSSDPDYDVCADIEHIHGDICVAYGYIPETQKDWLRKCALCGEDAPEALLMMLELRKTKL